MLTGKEAAPACHPCQSLCGELVNLIGEQSGTFQRAQPPVLLCSRFQGCGCEEVGTGGATCLTVTGGLRRPLLSQI